MRHETPGERTARLLAQRLEDVAGTLERSAVPTTSLARLLELASVATANAVRLDLITAERAGRIWDGVEGRHPVLGAVDRRLAERPQRPLAA